MLVGAGDRIPVPGRGDLTYPFRVHSEYLYLTDRERPGGVLAFDPQEGWVDFVAPVTRDERLWEGAAADQPEGVPVGELAAWLEQRKGRPLACLGAAVPGVASAAQLEADLRYGLNHVRRQKDAVELARMRTAEQATRDGFAQVAPLIEPGRSERELQIELEAAFFRGGADCLAFDTIVGSGPNSAVLHFPPTSRRLADGELILIDAGAEYRGYASDITRTYPASGAFTPEQQELYAIVAAALARATERCTAGTEWRDVHRAAALVIAEGLVELGLLRGEPESLVERGAQALFFPHGVGHMVGLGIRDAGEVLRGREPPEDGVPAPARRPAAAARPRLHGRARDLLRAGAPRGSRPSRATPRCRRLGARRGHARLRRHPHREQRADHRRRQRGADGRRAAAGLAQALVLSSSCSSSWAASSTSLWRHSAAR